MTFKSRLVVPVVALLLLTTFSTFAEDKVTKRRSVSPRSPGALITAPVTGTITDAVTGAPIAYAHVSGGRRSSQTDAQGRFEIKAAEGYGEITFEADRSGYLIYYQKLSGAGPHSLNIKLTPTPTVTVKKTDGSTIQADYENLKFGYAVPFSGFRASESETFCFGANSVADVHKSQLRRIIGPAVATASACCTNRTAVKVTIEQKTGQMNEVWFVDSCETEYRQDLIVTNHATGEQEDIPFAEIAEIVFP